MNDDRIASLLGEIRDNQRLALEQQRAHLEVAQTHLAQTKAQVEESLKLTREAVSRQRTMTRLAMPALLFCIAAIVYIAVRYL